MLQAWFVSDAFEREVSSLRVMFVASLTDRIGDIEKALAASDQPAARRSCHRLAGTAGSYQLHGLAAAARALEHALLESLPVEALFDTLVRVASETAGEAPPDR